MVIRFLFKLFLLFPFFVSLPASADQQEIRISSLPIDSVNISGYMSVFHDSTAKMSAINIDDLPEDKWYECSDSIDIGFKPGINYWFRFAINNDTDIPLDRLFYFSRFERVELYTRDNLNEPIERAGEIWPIRGWSYAADNHGVKIQLDNNKSKTYYVKCSLVKESLWSGVWFVLLSYENARSFQAYEIRAKMADILFYLFFLGSVTFCLVYFIGQYAMKYRDKAFLAYIVYLFAILVYSCRDFNAYYLKTVIPYFEGISYWGESTLWYFSFIAYNFFLIYFLNLGSGKKESNSNLDADGKRNRVAYHIVRFAIVFVMTMVIIDIGIKYFVSLTASYPVFNFGRDVAISISVFFIAVILPSRKPGTKYIIYGTLSLVFALVVNLLFKKIKFDTANCYFDLCHLSQYNFWTHTINFVRIGWLLEITFFSLGLAQKSRLEFAAAMIRENSDNEIAFHNHETRSGLTSLELMVFENPAAKSYLHKFREYLSSTMDLLMRKGKTTLDDEIELARKYFEFRKADDDAFHYEVEIEEAINTKDIEVPKALLIPFIQNAIKYNDNKSKMVKIHVLKKKNANCIQILDNGRGIDTKDYGKPDSFALQIVSRKIKLFNLLKGSHVKWNIENKKEGKGAAVTIDNLPQTN